MKVQTYLLLIVILSVSFISPQNTYANHTSITWNAPVQFNAGGPYGFLPGGQIVFSGSVSITACRNATRTLGVRAYLKDNAGNWQDLGAWSTSILGTGKRDYSINGSIPSTNQSIGLTDVKVDYNLGGETGSVVKSNHVWVGLCPLQVAGATTLSTNCTIAGTMDLFNGNLTIKNATVTIAPDSTFIFRNGYSITIGNNGYILKSASGSIIRKNPPYQYQYQSQYDYQDQGGEDEGFESIP